MKNNNSNVVYTTMTNLAHLIYNNKSKFMRVTHKKKDGSLNSMVCRILTPTVIGTILAIKMTGVDKGSKKSFYPKDLVEIKVNGINYIKK